MGQWHYRAVSIEFPRPYLDDLLTRPWQSSSRSQLSLVFLPPLRRGMKEGGRVGGAEGDQGGGPKGNSGSPSNSFVLSRPSSETLDVIHGLIFQQPIRDHQQSTGQRDHGRLLPSSARHP